MPPLSARGNAAGFTLVELAIALVIIALILGGIAIGGSSLVNQSKTSALIAAVKDLATASREFKTRYGYFPGDLPSASTQLIVTPAITAGCNYGPSVASAADGLVNTPTESSCAFEHLFKVGAVTKLDYDTTAGAYTLPSGLGGQVSFWFDPISNTNAIRITNLPCATALEIDRKFDSATANNKPFLAGAVTALDPTIENCVSGGANDPLPALLIKY